MAKRTIYAALFRYQDSDGRRRIARFGDVVDLPSQEVDRGKQIGVFDPPAVPKTVGDAAAEPTVAPAVEKALSGGVKSHTPQPATPVGEDELPIPPHNVVTDPESLPQADVEPAALLAPINQAAVGGDQPDPLKAEVVVEKPDLERPAKSAKHEVWADYVVKATAQSENPVTAQAAEDMTKDELQAVKV